MVKVMCIAAGGAVGAVARYAVSGAVVRMVGGGTAWGTLCVNLVGSFLIGVLAATFEHANIPANMKILLMTGLLGAFTTFSTFSLETVGMLDDGRWTHAAANVGGSCAMGVAMVVAGMVLVRAVVGAAE